jgi:hypothetical protein
MSSLFPEYRRGATSSQREEPAFSEHLFLGDSRQKLEESVKVTTGLLSVLEQDPRLELTDAIRLNRDHLHQTTVMLERRYARIERLETDPMMISGIRDQALALIIELPISQYLASIRPGILLWRDGNAYHGPCPCIEHDFDEDSFRIFNDDYAWCPICGGGNLFRVIGMVEALASPHDQVRRAAEIAGLDLPDVPRNASQHRSFPTVLHRDLGRKERSGRSNAFQPIRIVNGQVAL